MCYAYNETLINQTMEEFRNRCRATSIKPTVWFDMDNTLYVYSIYGKIDTALRECYNKGYYKSLPIFPEGPAVVDSLLKMGFDVGICSSTLNSPYCESEKRESINYYFPMVPKENILLVPEGQNKIEKIPQPKMSIMIDDWHQNIENMYIRGGIGIKKSYSQKKRPVPAIHNLVEIFPILQNLGCLA